MRNDESGPDSTGANGDGLAAAFAALPRELPWDPAQEERTVAALRAAGMLGGRPAEGPVAADVLPWTRRPGTPAWRHALRVGVGLAASLAIFAGGATWGEGRASRRTLEALLAHRDADARQAAVLVQRAGSAYVTSVADLAARPAGRPDDAAAVAQGREAARAVLAAAAAQVSALDPRDPVAREIVRMLQAPAEPRPDVVWF